MKTKSKIPDRWLEYSSLGVPIAGTRFICFKCPLKVQLCKKIRPNLWFTTEHLLQGINSQGYQLGLLIDLTNTDRYYDPSSITYCGVEYAKIFCPGHDLPDLDIIKRFYAVIDKYDEKYVNRDLLIGIHCTHGVNRTGYLLCRYMVERLGFSAQAAIKAFGDARGHPIERKNYLTDLYQTELHPILTEKPKSFNALEEASYTPKRKKAKEGGERHRRTKRLERKEKKRRARRISASSSDSSASKSAEDTGAATPDQAGPAVDPAQAGNLVMQQMFSMMAAGMQQYWIQAQAHAQPVNYTSQGYEQVQAQAASSGGACTAEEAEPKNKNSPEPRESSDSESDSDRAVKADSTNEEESQPEGEATEETREQETTEKGKSETQKRKERRKRLKNMFKKMRKGQFWEIREMQKEKYGL